MPRRAHPMVILARIVAICNRIGKIFGATVVICAKIVVISGKTIATFVPIARIFGKTREHSGATGNNSSRMNAQGRALDNCNRIDKTSVVTAKIYEATGKTSEPMSGTGARIVVISERIDKTCSRIVGISEQTARISEGIVHSGWAAVGST